MMGIAQADAAQTPVPRRAGALYPRRLSLVAGAFARGPVSWLHVVCVGSIATLAIELFDPVAYHLPALRASTEGAITLTAIGASLLLGVQFGYTRRLRDLVLLAALICFALLELVCDAVPAALQLRSTGQFAASLEVGQLFVAAAIVAAASTSSGRLVLGLRRPVLAAVLAGTVACVAAELAGLILAPALVVGAPRSVPGIGHALGRPLAAIVVIGTAALFLDAATRFRHQGLTEGSDALQMLAGAAVLLAAARLFYLALPWISPDSISSRELLRVLAMWLIVTAAVRQEFDLRARIVRAEALAERTRVARDLHDGLAQDLAFIAAHGARMEGELGAEHPIVVAARSALSLARGTITDLSDASWSTPREALDVVAGELRHRFGIAIAVEVDPGADLSAGDLDELLRIAREAITNAARHGHAMNVIASLARTDSGLVLRIRDDGGGIGVEATPSSPDGFGIRSMRERASALDGSLTVKEDSRGGTELEVTVR
jgi:signal transduction histidine kinase